MSSPAYMPVEFPDAEAWAIDWLSDQLSRRPDAWARNLFLSNEVPREGRRPARMILINHNGGDQRLESETVTLRVNVWAPTPQEAASITSAVQALLRVCWTDTTTPARSATVQGSQPVPDTTGGARRLFYAQIVLASQ